MNTPYPVTPAAPMLLSPADPPPFTVVNPAGQASAVLVCDHASNAIPARLQTLGLNTVELARHIAWDIGAAFVTQLLATRLNAPAILSGYSRLVIDCNRPPGDPSSIARVSDGTLIPGNHDVDDAEAQARLNEVFWPYHHAITHAITQCGRHGQAPLIIAIHSFTPVMNGFHRPWHLGILWNRDPRLAEPLLTRFRNYPELCVGDNQPYSGRDVGFTMDTHGGVVGLPHVEIEIRQDLLADEVGCTHWAGIVGDVLAATLQDASLYTVAHY